MATYTTRAALGKPATGPGWLPVYNRDLDQLDQMAAIGGFSVRPAAIDPTTGKATDRRIQIFGGFIESPVRGDVYWASDAATGSGGQQVTVPTATLNLPASTLTAVAINEVGTPHLTSRALPGSGLQFPLGYIPLALVYTDATKVTMIVDARNPARLINGARPLRLRKDRADSAAGSETDTTPGRNVKIVDAGTRAVTVDLWPLTLSYNEAFLVVKQDASANAVTVRPWPGGPISDDNPTNYPADTGPTVVLTGQYDAAMMVPNLTYAANVLTSKTWVRLAFI